jgi:hypothetical protein
MSSSRWYKLLDVLLANKDEWEWLKHSGAVERLLGKRKALSPNA